ncbi:adenylate/guanylate cyclase domain-containing protein [Geminicoccus roseus]|uniref:adenylate/guanylate cyclase domain-containing protein n=1 Tax=Geminicoccus roseus TaxID=404900 RepID=UPI000408E22C|nr:adenylate/guanylate cyclase domain-containing protein [Geminicoccus roseus]
MPSQIERKLTTILCADVAGYSGLMERDEIGTLDALRRHRGVFKGLIERHRGRVVNTWGDGLIAEFPSVVEAVRTAIEAQKELRLVNGKVPDHARLEFRVGINLGDVIVEGDDLYGEGVNVAARLQALAEPGGIVISGTVHDQVRGKLSVGFDYAGEQTLKNITDAVPAYRVTDGRVTGSATRPPVRPGQPEREDPPARTALGRLRAHRIWPSLRTYLLVVGFLFLLNLFSGLGNIWFQWPALIMGFVLALRWSRLS